MLLTSFNIRRKIIHGWSDGRGSNLRNKYYAVTKIIHIKYIYIYIYIYIL